MKDDISLCPCVSKVSCVDFPVIFFLLSYLYFYLVPYISRVSTSARNARAWRWHSELLCGRPPRCGARNYQGRSGRDPPPFGVK